MSSGMTEYEIRDLCNEFEGRLFDRVMFGTNKTQQQHLRLAIAHVVRQCRNVVREILQSSGASVHYLGNELQRIHRDVHMMCAHTVFDIDLVAEGVGRQIVASKEQAE